MTNPALQEAIDIEQLNLLVTDELHGAFNNSWCAEVDDAYGPDEGALRFVPEDARAAFSELPDQGCTFARPARTIHWNDGQTYWILWTLKDDAAVLWAYDPEEIEAVEILQVRDKCSADSEMRSPDPDAVGRMRSDRLPCDRNCQLQREGIVDARVPYGHRHPWLRRKCALWRALLVIEQFHACPDHGAMITKFGWTRAAAGLSTAGSRESSRGPAFASAVVLLSINS